MKNSHHIKSNFKFDSKEPYLKVQKDFLGRAHYRISQTTATNVARFIDIQEQYLKGSLIANSPECSLTLCLVLFDGVVTKSDLLSALDNHKCAFNWKGEIHIEWVDEVGRFNSRPLSPFTTNALDALSTTPLCANEIFDLIEISLAKYYPRHQSKLDGLLRDGQAWAFQYFPGPIFSHCSNIVPLAGLPRTALAREVSGLIIKPNIASRKNEGDFGIGFGMALDGYFSNNKSNGGSWLINQIVIICRSNSAMSDQEDKYRMLKKCLELVPQAGDAGPICSLVLAWVIDLIESGASREANLSPRTIPLYVGTTVVKLFQNFEMLNIEDVTEDQFISIYKKIRDSAKLSRQRNAASALLAWHSFIVLWLDVPPVYVSIFNGIPPIIPKANCIWPHEIETIYSWLERATCDRRMIQQIQVSLRISTNIRIRIKELLNLRLNNIRVFPDGLEIEISPLRHDGQLKSTSSRRVVEIKCKVAIECITNWKNQREAECALSSDLLFADPYKPSSGYRLGQMYFMVSRLLKASTGDETACFHMLSHDWVSRQLEASLLQPSLIDTNPFEQRSAEAGHSSSQTTFIHYFHFFGMVIRHYLDKAIKSIRFTGRMVATNSNISAAAYRKRCARKMNGSTNQEIAWEAIMQSRQLPDAPTADSLYTMVPASPPQFLFQHKGLKFADILKATTDLATGLPIPAISARCGMAIDQINEIVNVGCQILEELRLLSKSGISQDADTAYGNLQRIFTNSAKQPIQFHRLCQPKYSPLLNYFLGNPDLTIIEAAVNSWSACFKNGYVSLERPARSANLIRMLHIAHFPNDQIVVCIALPKDSSSQPHKLQAQIISSFCSIYSIQPIIDAKSSRRGRPTAYLSLASNPPCTGDTLGSAGVSIAGLNALMFSLAIYIRISSIKSESIERN